MQEFKKNNLFAIMFFLLFFLFSSLLYGYTYQEGLSSYEDGNKAKSFRIWYLLSLEGNSNADYGLGLLYLNGFEELNKNITIALEYLQKADNANITAASYQLGLLYEKGEGVSQNNKKAFNYYSKAADDDHLPSILKLADSYENGTLSLPDPFKACELWGEVASFSNIEGYYNTALCLKYSKGDIQDFNKAIEYLKLSGDKGIIELYIADFPTEKINCDWYESLHSKNEVEGTYKLANCYRNAEGRESNQKLARKYFEIVIKDNDYYAICDAQLELGRMFIKGDGGDKEITFADNLLEQIINNTSCDNDIHQMAIKTRAEIVFGWVECKKQLDAMNYSDKTKKRCIQAAENKEHCALLEIIKHYKKGTAGFEKDPDQAKYWQNILDNLIGIARSPQSGWSGQLKKCND